MNDHDVFWELEGLSDGQLLERLGLVLGSSRRLMAELIAHLGEVEDRRLHLAAACSSMFAYCLKLGMTEDEAYRRIEVARLARRYPAIFPLLAAGQLTISTVALLKHRLSEENHLELLAAMAGRSVVQARELIAARFPRPDVPSSVRKLPERRAALQPSFSMAPPTDPCSGATASSIGGTASSIGGTASSIGGTASSIGGTASSIGGTASSIGGTVSSIGGTVSSTGGTVSNAGGMVSSAGTTPSRSHCEMPTRASSRVEPLSAQRYKVQFTASAELARKLELARDLMRHSHPGGELGPIVERALDLLIESLMQRRFGKQTSPTRASVRARRSHPEQRGAVMSDSPATRGTPGADATTTLATAEPAATTTLATEPPTTTTPASAVVQGERHGELPRASVSSYIPRSTRRAVVERDGLGCVWVDEHGVRCGSLAWLEYDHRHPRAKGGGAEADNLRLLCRSHNRLAAERELGRKHVERSIDERRRERAPHAI